MAGFFKNLYNKVANRADVDWDELEADLIAADLGVRTSLEIVENLRTLGRKISADDVVEAARERILQVFPDDNHTLELPEDGSPLVILVVGVNGTGKTTSAAKLGNLFARQGVSVLLAAALYLLEIFIGFVQAFIFTLLTALFVSMAAHPDH